MQRVDEAGVSDRVEIRSAGLSRTRAARRSTPMSSIGMFEHVGSKRAPVYFDTLHSLLIPRGRLLNHAISSVSGTKIGRRSFIGRYVFPDGELMDVADTQRLMEIAGFEVRDVESLPRALRDHAAQLGRQPQVGVGLGGRHWSASGELACGCCTWRRRPSVSRTGASTSTRCSESCPTTTGASAMPRTRDGW